MSFGCGNLLATAEGFGERISNALRKSPATVLNQQSCSQSVYIYFSLLPSRFRIGLLKFFDEPAASA